MTVATRNSGEDASLELSFFPSVRLVPTVRRFVSEFYSEAVDSAAVTSQLAVATHELLENAVRYSLDGNTSSIRVGVQRLPKAVRVAIETWNRASTASIATLRVALDELAAASDPDAYYQVLIRRSAKRTDGSGLGFGRVRAESGMAVSYEIDDDAVHVRAQARFEAGAQGGQRMLTIDVPAIHTEELHSEATYAPPGVNVRLIGSAESMAMAPLGELLGRLHGEAVRLEVREVTIDMRELEFINSSCFRTFVTWLGVLQDLERDQQYRIRFLSDEHKHWQRRSLGALTSFAEDLVQIED